MNDAMLWAFEHFYHMDKANACMHCAPVRFSPITFRLAEEILKGWAEKVDLIPELAEVKRHMGQYELDPGR